MFLRGLIFIFVAIVSNLNATISERYHSEFNKPLEVINEASFPGLLQEMNALYAPKQPGVTRYVFLRHGKAWGNVHRLYDGQTLNLELTPAGIEEAQAVGQQFEKEQIAENWKFDVVISSPSKRALETAENVLAQLSQKPALFFIDNRVLERHAGKADGKSKLEPELAAMEKIMEQQIEDLPTFWDKFDYKFDLEDPKEESYRMLFDRAMEMIEENASNDQIQGKTVLVTSHACLIKALFIAAVAKNHHKDMEIYRVLNGNTSFIVLDVKDNNFEVVRVQGYTFLPKK